MVQLLPQDIQTKEVLSWQGVHLFHFAESTCSQKTRIFLALKGIRWHSHHLNLARKAHQTAYYMGINPRGLVPTLVHDGKVIIESNDIITYLEASFPEPSLIPAEHADEIAACLRAEDDLHLAIRAITMRFVFPSFLAKRSEKDIASYERLGAGTVQGSTDENKAREAAFWRRMLRHGQIPDPDIKAAFRQFCTQLEAFDAVLASQPYLVGNATTVADIAWYIYVRRLTLAGYPLARHERVSLWFAKLDAMPEFREEVPSGGLSGLITSSLHFVQSLRHTRLVDIAGAS